MDISAAKDVINMYIEMINKEMAEENRTAAMQAVSEAEALLRLLPDLCMMSQVQLRNGL